MSSGAAEAESANITMIHDPRLGEELEDPKIATRVVSSLESKPDTSGILDLRK